jgi:hypothetical protein
LQHLAAGKIGQEGLMLRRGLEVMAQGRIASLAYRLSLSPGIFGAIVVGGLCHGKAATGQEAKGLFAALMWHLPGKASSEKEVNVLLSSVLEIAPKPSRLLLLEALALKVSCFITNFNICGLFKNHKKYFMI